VAAVADPDGNLVSLTSEAGAGRFVRCASVRLVGIPVYAGAMAEQPDGAQGRYEDLVDELLGIDGVTPPPGGSGFGRGAVRFRNKIFVMFVRGRLVLKLPADRVSELVGAGEGVHFDANKGTPMKEWLSLDPESGLDWLPLAHEALEFARAAAR
jgi:hypothetical protein